LGIVTLTGLAAAIGRIGHVEQKVDVLFSTWGTAAPLALKQAGAMIPIVAGAVGDRVAARSR
jgi:hypothetical protein